jgi:hypothetical protein
MVVTSRKTGTNVLSRSGRIPWALALAFSLVTTLMGTPASAAVSVGASEKCDSQGHCVVGGAFSLNAGSTNMTDVQIPGKAVAGCTGSGNLALVIDITCTISGASDQMSFPGTYGAVPMVVNASHSGLMKVCWVVTGTFFNLTGPAADVTTRGCALVAA